MLSRSQSSFGTSSHLRKILTLRLVSSITARWFHPSPFPAGSLAASKAAPAAARQTKKIPLPLSNSHLELGPEDTPSDEPWNYTRQLAAHHRTLPADSLFTIAEDARLKNNPPLTSASSYALVIRALYCRHQYEEGARWWARLWATGSMNEEGAFWAMRTLVRAGKLRDALQILEIIHAANQTAHRSAFKLEGFDDRVLPHFVQHFLYALQGINRPDLVLQLWDSMGILYGVEPNGTLLETLADAARMSLKLDDTLFPVPQPTDSPLSILTSRSEALTGVFQSLAERRPHQIRWRNEHPALVARQVWCSVIIGNIPTAALLPCPISQSNSPSPANLELIRPHHTFHPTNLTFLNYFHLLASISFESEIPRGLAWMRASGIKPSMQALGFALAYCARAEMTAGPPVHDGYGKNYADMVEWMKGWLGEEWKLEPGIGYWLLKARGIGGRTDYSAKPPQTRRMPRLPPAT